MSILSEIASVGQSIWLDNINRTMLNDGSLDALINKGLRGMTSNPSIFMKAISQSSDYDSEVVRMKGDGKSTFDIYDALTIKDVQDATDKFRTVYNETKGLDGYVSLEINPKLANEDDAQFEEGWRLWQTVDRPNLMVKVPATENGVKVVQKLIAKGVNVNTTLIFSVGQYEQVALAYIAGIKIFAQSGGDVSKVHSVASFFVSRIDSAIDKLLEDKKTTAQDDSVKVVLQSLKGCGAVANCECAFDLYDKLFNGDAFADLKSSGANVQRLLWASTSTKDPSYSDVKYVTELIANPTVNTLPAPTLDAVLDHGQAAIAIPSDINQAHNIISELKANDIQINDVCNELLAAGVDAFIQSYDELMSSIDQKASTLNV